MPPWITSLLREETPLPMPPVASATITSWPRRVAARATASPTTPAPTTRTCIALDPCRVYSTAGIAKEGSLMTEREGSCGAFAPRPRVLRQHIPCRRRNLRKDDGTGLAGERTIEAGRSGDQSAAAAAIEEFDEGLDLRSHAALVEF